MRAGALRLYDHGDVLPVSDSQNLPWKGDGYVGFGAMAVVGEGSEGKRNRILRCVEEGELLVLREAFGQRAKTTNLKNDEQVSACNQEEPPTYQGWVALLLFTFLRRPLGEWVRLRIPLGARLRAGYV